jgi:Ca-activated chloride channel family protein
LRGQRADLTLSQLYGGQEKFALVEVEIAPARAGAELEIAQARVSFEDALHQRSATLRGQRSVRFSESRADVVRSADHKVQADYAANLIAVAKDEAVALVDANRKEEAAAVLRKRTQELQNLADTYSNREVGQVAAAAAPAAAKMERDGLGNAERKTLRAEAAQTANQQYHRGTSASGPR